MFLPLALHLLIGQTPQTIELFRGAAIAGIAPRYWETEDTTLDSTAADINQGWQTELYGGEGKTILIQFKGLDRVVGPNKKVVKASLVLTIASGDKIELTQINRILQPWNQGPVRTILEMNPDNTSVVGAVGSATWRARRLGRANWAHTGALGEEDSKPIAGATTSQPDQDHFEIDNLAPTVQEMLDSPLDNNGFLLQFKAPVSFFSAEAPRSRPKLVLEVADAAPASGPDLAVTFIERKEKFDRYDHEGGAKTESQDGQPVPVLDHALNDTAQKWPSEGADVMYVAHVKNLGSAASGAFSIQPYVDEKPSGPAQAGQSLRPGEEAVFPLRVHFKNNDTDHRLYPISFHITQSSGDGTGSDKGLEIQQDALAIGVSVEQSFYDRAASKGSFEKWIQGQVALLNQVYFPYSRFSFAKDGVLERIRIDHIAVVPDGSLLGPNNLPGGKVDLSYDAELGFPASDSADLSAIGPSADVPFLKRLLVQLGAVDFSAVTFPAGDPRLASVGKDGTISCGLEDIYPGIMGGGDTRDDAPLPLSISIPYQPVQDEVVTVAGLESTDLLSASTVSEFTTDLGKRRGFEGDFLYDTPPLSVVSVLDYNGNPISKAQLTFYQMAGGQFSANSRAFNLTTNEDGVVSLFKRDPLTGGDDRIATGHTLASNPFGRIDSRGLNSVFLVRAVANGCTAWTPLKLWQLVDATHRGQKIALLRMYFDIPSNPLNTEVDLAVGKSISSSDSGLQLAGLVDGKASSDIDLPKDKGAWVEIDLGRDLTVGEVQLVTKGGKFWKTFDMKTYETAQKPSEALPWAHEMDWNWSLRNRPTPVANGVAVAYHGPARRFRYLRIINTGGATDAALAAIKLVPIKQGG